MFTSRLPPHCALTVLQTRTQLPLRRDSINTVSDPASITIEVRDLVHLMGVGRFCLTLVPLALTAAVVALGIVTFLGSYKSLNGLRDVYFLKIDFSGLSTGGISLSQVAEGLGVYNIYQVGANGYCYGNKNGSGVDIEGCRTPSTPFWFDLVGIVTGENSSSKQLLNQIQLPGEISKYETVLKAASYALWSCLIATICLQFLALLSGVFSICAGGLLACSSVLSALGFLTALVAAGVATGLYKIYGDKFNQTANTFGATASLGTTGLALIWVTAAVSLGASLLWTLVGCCGCCAGASGRGRYRKTRHAPDEKPFVGYHE